MSAIAIVRSLSGFFMVLVVMMIATEALSQVTNSRAGNPGEQSNGGGTEVSVFSGTTRAMTVEELRTNALEVLRVKGYTVPRSARCAINVKVQGGDAGCAVMFFDLEMKRQYLVTFDASGRASEVWGGAMHHGTVGPNDPRPTVPEGAVKVKP
jgi:hypothetical protein